MYLNKISNWDKIRDQILARDKDACIECGATNKRLHIHHIDKDRHNNNPDNLTTLCCCHHKRRHGNHCFCRLYTLWK